MSNTALKKTIDETGGAGASSVLAVDPFRSLLVHFGMLLGVADFETVDAYHRGKMWMHSAWLHRDGAVWGLGVSVDTDAGEVRVAKGLAIDALGREMYLDPDACLSLGRWYDEHKDDADLAEIITIDEDGSVHFDAHVVMRFKPCLSRQVPALTEPCDGAGSTTAYSRIVETVELELRPGLASEWRTPAGSLPYHRLRLLFGLEEAIEEDGAVTDADQAVLDAVDAITLKPDAERPSAYLEAFRRFSALDEVETLPALGKDGEAYSLFPATDPAPMPLANIEGITLSPDEAGWTVLLDDLGRDNVDQGVRPVHLPTSTIQELLCGPPCRCTPALIAPPDADSPEPVAPGPDGIAPGADAGGPRIDAKSVGIQGEVISFKTAGTNLRGASVSPLAVLVELLPGQRRLERGGRRQGHLQLTNQDRLGQLDFGAGRQPGATDRKGHRSLSHARHQRRAARRRSRRKARRKIRRERFRFHVQDTELAMADKVLGKTGFVVIGGTGGHTVIPKESPLKRLNYFDGKFLRAPDLKLEQLALLNQVRLANRAGGAGVVYGYDCTLGAGDALNVGAGFAVDSAGRALYLTQGVSVGIAELIEKSRALDILMKQSQASFAGVSASFTECEVRAEAPPGQVLDPNDLYLITVGHSEAYCGEEDVYGKLCEEACITSTERPYIIEGVVIRAVPLSLSTLLPTSTVPLSNKHLRSRVASAYFEQEWQNGGSLISGEGMVSGVWCLGATAALGNDLPIGVIARSGDSTLFLDAWIARRERMESPPRHYWAGRMAMRPWNVFLAQVLQFQCQLTTCFRGGGGPGQEDPCAEERTAAKKAAEELRALMQKYEAIAAELAKIESVAGGAPMIKKRQPVEGLAQAYLLQQDLIAIAQLAPASRLLINCGIIELPSGGYLPVDAKSALTVNEQIRRMMGEGVDLRFCVVRPDYIPHALEEAQHMERISLLEGIDNPARKPGVDVLVPDGRIEEFKPEIQGVGYEMDLHLGEAGLAADRTVRSAYTKGGVREASVRFGSLFARGFRFSLRDTFAVAAAASEAPQKQPKDPRNTVQGGARGEQLDGGGFAFYYAARTPESLKLLAMELVRPNILETGIEGFRPVAGEAAAKRAASEAAHAGRALRSRRSRQRGGLNRTPDDGAADQRDQRYRGTAKRFLGDHARRPRSLRHGSRRDHRRSGRNVGDDRYPGAGPNRLRDTRGHPERDTHGRGLDIHGRAAVPALCPQ